MLQKYILQRRFPDYFDEQAKSGDERIDFCGIFAQKMEFLPNRQTLAEKGYPRLFTLHRVTKKGLISVNSGLKNG